MANETCEVELIQDIVAVYPFREDELDYQIPFDVFSLFIKWAEIGLAQGAASLKNRFRLSLTNPCDGSAFVELDESGTNLSAQMKKKDGMPYFDCSLSLILNKNNPFSAGKMMEWANFPHHFIIENSNGDFLLLRPAPQGYEFYTEESHGGRSQCKVTWKISSMSGLNAIT